MNGKSSKKQRLGRRKRKTGAVSMNYSRSSEDGRYNNTNGHVNNGSMENTILLPPDNNYNVQHNISIHPHHQHPPPNGAHIPPLGGGAHSNSLGRSYGSLYSSDYTSSSASFGSGGSFIFSSTPNTGPLFQYHHAHQVPFLNSNDRSGSYTSYDTPPPPPPAIPPAPMTIINDGPVVEPNVNVNDFSSPPPPPQPSTQSPIKAVVEKNGYVSFILAHDVIVDVAPNQAIRIHNKKQGATLALSGCGTQMSLVHPQGRVLQYNSRIEMQGEDGVSVKNAKMWPKGVSFTANNCALVYLVDKAGVRSTSDSFFDLSSNNTSDSMFLMSCSLSAPNLSHAIYQCIENLRDAEYWRTEDELNCWRINGVLIKQTADGLTTVERYYGAEKFVLKTSPNNGKARLESSFLYITASLGEEAHIFIKSEDRRLHYNGNSFQIRNGGHAAGFNEVGSLRIW